MLIEVYQINMEQNETNQVKPPPIFSPFRKALPNYLTYLRFLLIPFFVLLLTSPTPWRLTSATIIFVIAAFTDWLDGYLARLYDAESVIGKMLDPLADQQLL
jgi:CDP-diacylglycerol---glycerol-3-phosphate 3-phosphatidyltransferase